MMFLKTLIKEIFISLFLYEITDALPSVNFLRQFIANHQRSSVIFHVPDDNTVIDCLKW